MVTNKVARGPIEDSCQPGHPSCLCKVILSIDVAPITQYTHVRNENSNTQGSSTNEVKVSFHTLRNCS